ncbi:MAG: polysaccharide deacetylase family protein [Treponema sp.]|nr:polysaccharide deacetylase family protein [Treponema sp.]
MKLKIKSGILLIIILCIFTGCIGKNTNAPIILFENGKWASLVGTVTTVIPGGDSVLEYLPNGNIRIFNGSGDTFTSFTFNFSKNVNMGSHTRLIIELATPYPEGGWVGAGAIFRNADDSADNTFLWWGGKYYDNGVFTLDGLSNAPSSSDGIGNAANWLTDRLNGFNLTPLNNDTMLIKRIYVDSASSDTANKGKFVRPNVTYPAPTMYVALTIDDGPTGANTLKLLDILDDWDTPVPVTWFVLGQMLGNPGSQLFGDARIAMDRKITRGDDFANHSWGHLPNGIGTYTKEQLEDDFKMTQNRILELTGQNVKWFRHPRYDSIEMSLSIISDMGLVCIRNGVNGDPNDWDYNVTAAMLVERMTNNSALYNGQVFLLHDLSQASTAEALEEIIHILRTKGVGFMTLSQLQAHTGKVITPGTVIYDFVP